MKFYLTQNSTLPVVGFRFLTVAIQASSIGIYKTEVEAAITKLDEACGNPRIGVSEITEAEYNDWLAMKRPEPNIMRHVSPTGTIFTSEPSPQKVVSVSGGPTINEQAVESTAVRRTGRAARRAAAAGGSDVVV